MTCNSHHAGAEMSLAVLALPGSKLIKVHAKATPSSYLTAASAGQCTEAMAAVLGMLVAAGGLASTPMALLASHSQVASPTRTVHSVMHWKQVV